MRPVRSIVALTALALAAGPLAAGAANASPPSAATVLGEALSNARHAHWVHEFVETSFTKGGSYTQSDVVGATSGSQVFLFGTTGVIEAIAFPARHVAYVKGTANVLRSFLRLSASVASHDAGRWLALTPADAQYTGVVQGMTLNSDFSSILPRSGKISFGPNTAVNGTRARTIVITSGHGTTAEQIVVVVPLSGRLLPLGARAQTPTASAVVAWTKWGVPAHLTAPSGAVPLAAK